MINSSQKLTVILWFFAEKPGRCKWQKTDKKNKRFHLDE